MSASITWTGVRLRQHKMTHAQDSRALTHLLGALDSMCDDREHEITSARILGAVQRAFEYADPDRDVDTAATVPQDVADALDRAGARADAAESTLSPWQRREISGAYRAMDDYYRLTED